MDFRQVHRFAGAVPLDLVIHQGTPFVGTIGPGDSGALWGPQTLASETASLGSLGGSGPLPEPPPAPMDPAEIDTNLAALESAIGALEEPFAEFADALGRRSL